MNSIEQKIQNRQTELQRAYDAYCAEQDDLLAKIDWYERELEWSEKRLKQVREQINYCKQRAVEQGYPDAL